MPVTFCPTQSSKPNAVETFPSIYIKESAFLTHLRSLESKTRARKPSRDKRKPASFFFKSGERDELVTDGGPHLYKR